MLQLLPQVEPGMLSLQGVLPEGKRKTKRLVQKVCTRKENNRGWKILT